MEKVFISSPVYDLMDVRQEVKMHLQGSVKFLSSPKNGYDSVLSDSSEESFEISPKIDSIENCLENIRAAQHYILIISQRYGPTLGKSGFEDISATHLEYREA